MNPSKLSVYDEDFLLENDVARELYHDYAKHQPIIDYHCHLPPEQVAKNHRFRTITEIWLDGDHYKWRALRTNGIPEVLVTGPAGDWDRFSAWARTVPKTLKNPLYHFTHLELKKPFGIRDRLLSADTARGIYDDTNFRLADSEFSALGLMRQFNVAAVCTTDDPADDLVHHRAYRESPAWEDVRMFPSFRPDGALEIEDPSALRNYITRLSEVSGVDISSFNALLEALDRRHAAFHELGCRLSDHGLETMFSDDFSESEVEQTFEQALRGRVVEPDQAQRYRSALLHELARLDSARGWTQQFHLGAIRGLNSRMLQRLGPNTGYDSIGDATYARPLARFLDRLDQRSELPKTILYNLNPKDNEMLAALIGCFQDGSVRGKMQFGSAWWFLDQYDGIRRQLDALGSLGLIACFVGMLTDSRSFLSYSRHEYFRRIFCNWLGEDVARGRLPDDRPLLAELVTDVCFRNARDYFGLELPRGLSNP